MLISPVTRRPSQGESADPSTTPTNSQAGQRRVALALELGAADATVLEQVRGMPLPADVEIALMHVAESAASRYLGDESSDEESRADRDSLECLAAGLRAFGLSATVMLGHGDVKEELTRMVGEWRADLLITGSHGHRLLGDLFLSSTASGMRHRVRCAVLSVRMQRRAAR